MSISGGGTGRQDHVLTLVFFATGLAITACEVTKLFLLPDLPAALSIVLVACLAVVGVSIGIRKILSPSQSDQREWPGAEQIIGQAAEGILSINQRGQVLWLNPAAERLFGYRSAEVVNQPLTKLITEPPAHERQSLLRDTLPSGSILGLAAGAREVIGKRKNGDTFSLELTGNTMVLGKDSVSVAFVRDVSKRKRAQRYLLAHYAATCILAEANSLPEALPRILQALCEALHCEAGAYWRIDPNAEAAPCADVYLAPFSSLPALPDTKDLHCKPGRGLPGRVWSSARPVWVDDLQKSEECPCQSLAGELRLHGGFGFPVVLGQEVCGVVTLFYGHKQRRDQQLLDIMVELGKQLGHFLARKRDEEMLRETTQTLQALVQAAPVAIHIVDLQGKVRLWNPAAERIFGWTAAEVVGQPLPMLQEGGQQANENQHLAASSPVCQGLPIRCPTKHGRVIEVSLSTAPLVDSGGTILGVMGIRMDLTEQKKLEEQLRQAQKMEAVGQLAGGVAHDFNNLLTVITGYSEVLLENRTAGETVRASLEEIQKAGQKAAGLTRQLLAFSRKQILQPTLLDLNELVTDMQKMLGRLIGEDIQLLTLLATDLGPVKADHGQIEQILVNLAVNARDAMPRGGTLTIETRDVEIDEGNRQIYSDLRPGRYACLAVTDTGSGMDTETLAHIFEPFFTTKELGKGTGLGLATVYGIVKQSGGQVRASSEPGKGARFEVYLPIVAEEVLNQEEEPSRLSPREGKETILLAEDEDGVRALVRQVLYSKGYTVLEAINGEEALHLAETSEVPVDLLLTDVIMPHVGGRALAEAVLSHHPKAKILYISGYTDDAVLRNGVLHSESEFLQKPFKADDLLFKVREVLDKGAGSSSGFRKTHRPTGSQSGGWSADFHLSPSPKASPEAGTVEAQEACLETAS